MSTGGMLQLFVTHWHVALAPDLEALLIAALYLFGVVRAGRWPLRRTVSFLAGLGTVLVALQSGIGSYDERLLSVHMVQHMLLLLVAPALLLGGRPTLLALRALRGGQRQAFASALRRVARFTGPVPCVAIFSGVVMATHLPGFYDATLRHPLLHDAEHAAYLAAGLLMWWPLLGGDPVPAHRLGGLGKLIYVLATMPSMALVGAYLNRVPHLVYTPYGPPAHALGVNPLIDQAQAGAIMWVAGTVLVSAVGLWAVLAALVAEERRQQAREARTAIGPLGGDAWGGM